MFYCLTIAANCVIIQSNDYINEENAMAASRSRSSIPMTEGSLFRNTFLFSLPLILSSWLQLLFNAADTIVVGRFSGAQALAAVGSTGSINQLLICLFLGLGTGANVIVARAIGAKNHDFASRSAHTAIATALLSGVILSFLGFFLSRPLLKMMDSPADVIDLATTYMRIIFIGMPMQLLYNFCAALLRSVGDTKKPLYFLTVAGVVNVILNLFFVIVLDMSVAGVAIATVISHTISSLLALRSLTKRDDMLRIDLKKLRIEWKIFIEIARVGLPTGIQSAMFSIANVLIQSTRNSFGSIVMAGCAASSNVGGFISQGLNAFAMACTSFVSQNYGAKKPQRILRSMWVCQIWSLMITGALGVLGYFFGEQLLSLYNNDPEVIKWGMEQFMVVNVPYFLMGFQSIFSGALRGIGYSLLPMIISIVGICIFRVVWVMTIFKLNPTLRFLNISYPISWTITGIVMGITFFCFFKRVKARLMQDTPAAI